VAKVQMDAVIQHLRRVVLLKDGAGMTDAQLLESFIAQKSEVAFEALVHRHGAMVMKVCQGIVRNRHDAEDAFQSTFLILVRKASSIRYREMVASWLHGVARRCALKALRVKRRVRERQVSALPEPPAVPTYDSHELRPIIDQELSRLGEVYRLPVLLCDLEGKSIKETTRQLGWPQGTVAGRLARGRKMLAKRLARRGLALSAGALAPALCQQTSIAAVPASWIVATVKAASAYGAGKTAASGVVSANVAILTGGVMRTMFWTKRKVVTALVLAVSAVTVGSGVFRQTQVVGQQTTFAKDVEPANSAATARNGRTDARKNSPPVAASDHEKLRGTWKVVEYKGGGKVLPHRPEWRWWIGKDKIVTTFSGVVTPDSANGRQEMTYHLWGDHDDRVPAPQNINMTLRMVNEAPHAASQLTYRGIFAFDGDRLTLCFRQRNLGERPAKIPVSTSKNDNLLIVVLERDTDPKTDEDRVQGDWKAVGGKDDGEQMVDAEVSMGALHVSFVGDLMIFTFEEEQEVVFKLDSSKNPKQITSGHKSGDRERQRAGIYALDGDELKICLADYNYPRPDAFTAEKGSRRLLLVLKREKTVRGSRILAEGEERASMANDPKKIEDFLLGRLRGGYLRLKDANYEIFVTEVKAGRLIRPVLIRRNGDGHSDLLVVAKSATLTVDGPKGDVVFTLSEVDFTSTDGDHAATDAMVLRLPLNIRVDHDRRPSGGPISTD
jgi:RNA polymerase sigma factor (sigma-70 family)